MTEFEPILIAILSFIPAMIANSLAVVFGGGPPIDGGIKFGGKRILGDGKTWRGLFGGGLSAAVVGIILYFLCRPFFDLYPSLLQGLVPIFSLAFGSLLGDIGGSFVKRRMGKPRGSKAPMIDRYDFVIGAFLLT
ncbi:MAG: CDP-archaeol synthase, partial [Candidatus Natronoplasma sp.]